MTAPLTRIRRGATMLVIIFLVSVVARSLLTDRPLLDSMHWFVITVSTVGYSEESNAAADIQIFTIAVILFGLSVTAYTFGGFLQLLTQGEVERALGVRRMTHDIDLMHNHTIVCGFGRLGKSLTEDLEDRKLPFVVIELNDDYAAEARHAGYLVVEGDSTDEDVLKQAGVDRAKTLIAGLSSDADCVFLTLTARNLNPRMHIIARGEQPQTETKLLQAGANRVVLPPVIGARRIAAMLSRPHATELLDLFSDRRVLNVELEEFEIVEQSPLVDKHIRETAIREHYNLLVVALRRTDGEMVFNPPPDTLIHAGDTAIVMGNREDVLKFHRENS